MFNDRDLGILGGGALLAVLCLFLPFSFAGKVVVGFLVLVGFVILALLRLGPDRVPPEVWLTRRLRYAARTHRFVNQQATSRKRENRPADHKQPLPQPQVAPLRPVDLAWQEVGLYPLASALLGVVGIYFVFWLSQGGAEQLSMLFHAGGVR